MKKDTLITVLILLGLVLGAILGQILHMNLGEGEALNPIWMDLGDIVLIRPLKLMVIPLVFLSVVVGVTSIGDPSKLGLVGGSTLVYYLSTMLLAVILGTALVSTITPGDSLTPEQQLELRESGESEYQEQGKIQTASSDAEERGLGGAWFNILEQVIPTNFFSELVNGRTLGVIVFALLLGLALAACGPTGEPAIRVFESLFQGMMRLVLWILWLTPAGVFFLVTGTVGRIGFESLIGPLGGYMSTVLIGLGIHGLIVLPLILWILGRTNPYRFMFKMRKALLTAFGTDSSSATLPVTIETAIDEGGCSKRSSNFVLPLGATVNMDGTALYEAVAVVFLFQLYGIQLEFAELIIVVITATLAAVGAAGIPSAGLITMVIVIGAVNTSLAGRGIEALPLSAVGVIYGVDRLLDMCRTVVNVWGDATGAKIITRLAPDPEPDAPPSGG
ncbi:MAG: dicarboxylate/amino acid:cation symporter [Planctomycetota bacterium]|nr:dicarboxylate/amino acid:cation symporter [Planctomycetota bacterium]